MDIEAEIASLQSRVAKLEAAPAQPVAAPGSGVVAPIAHPSDFTAVQVDGTPISRAPDGSLPPSSPVPDPGVWWIFDGKLGQWVQRYVGNVGHNPEQDYINLGGNVGQYAGFEIFVAKTPGLAEQPIAAQYAAWVEDQKRSTAEGIAADTPGDWGDAWKSFVAPEVDDIDRNFNALKYPDRYVYVAAVAPNRLALRYFGPQPDGMAGKIGVALQNVFCGQPGGVRAGLHLEADAGYAGTVAIEGSDMVVNGTVRIPLPFGGLNLHGVPGAI